MKWLIAAWFAFAIVFSVVVFWKTFGGRMSTRLTVASIVVDVVTFALLAGLWLS